jgi:hypothetical protein
MPVRLNKPSDLITDQRFDQNPPDPARARGVLHVIAGTMTNLADDDSGSTFLLCTIPANAILDSNTRFSSATAGYAQIRIGTRANPVALLNAARAAVLSPVAFGGAMHGLAVWQQLGMAAQPDTAMIDLMFTANANATGAGTMPFEVWYRDGN